MEAIKIEVTGNIAKVIEKPLRITSGTVGLPVEFVFDSHWDNMTKVAVFNTGIVTKNMKIVGNSTVVPIEALAVPELNLSIGVYGVSADGSVATPTVWASVGQIRHGAVPGSSFGSDIGTAKKYYDLGEQAAEKADASAKKAESDASVAENAADRADAFARSAAASAALAGEEAEYAIIECTQLKNAAINAKHDAEVNAARAEAAADRAVNTYYNTTREDLGIAHENVTAEYIYGLYDALMKEHPDNVQKNEVHNDDGTFTNYEYVISTGEYTTDALYAEQYGADHDIKKPKYLISSGIHGTERNAVLSAYRFIRDVLNGHNVPESFKEGAIIHIMPVGTPSAFNRFTRENGDNIDINRNFSSATPAKETQAIKNWLNTNADADLYIDFHNNGAVHEVVAILGDSDNDAVDMVKKIALKGVDRIIPFWKNVIGYPPVEAPYFDGTEIKTEVRDVIFSYCANAQIDGSAQMYASNALSIPSTTIEVSVYYGDYSDWDSSTETYPPETIAAGAEAIGNILLEFYEQSFVGEVIDDMKGIDRKLDDLLAQVNSGFRVESGVLVVGADVTDPTDSIIEIKIPCTNGAKMLTFQPDGDTLNRIIKNTSAADGVPWLVGAMGNCVTQVGNKANRGYMQRMENVAYGGKNYWTPTEVGSACDNSDGFTLGANGLKAGTYNWTAYYWNE